MKLRLFKFLVIVFSLSACGKSKQSMHFAGLEGMPSEQHVALSKGISQFNALLGSDVLAASNEGFEVAFNVQSQQALNEKAPGLKENSLRNAYAESEANRCIISVSEALFQPEKEQILLTVILHELGHCAGLRHNGASGRIMSESPAPYSAYSQAEIDSFTSDLQAALGINK